MIEHQTSQTALDSRVGRDQGWIPLPAFKSRVWRKSWDPSDFFRSIEPHVTTQRHTEKMKTSEVGIVNKFIPEEEATHTAGAWEETQCFWNTEMQRL